MAGEKCLGADRAGCRRSTLLLVVLGAATHGTPGSPAGAGYLQAL